MPSEPQPFDAQQLLALKDTIRRTWEQLPPAHQASLLLVLLRGVLEGEYGDWLAGVIRLLDV
ncbi:MAG: hypothetical protein H6673_10025 [Anaerolineales bacterium]|nr:hypothetical protein [Anaerolineales bacterium]